jgi:hypothetical protein
LPDFSYIQYTKNTKLPLKYQMAINVLNGCNIFQMTIEYINLFHSKAHPKFTQIGIFGMKIYHLATLYLTIPSNFGDAGAVAAVAAAGGVDPEICCSRGGGHPLASCAPGVDFINQFKPELLA